MDIMKHHDRNPQLANVARTFDATSRTPGRLNRRQQQPNHDRDNRDHNQQFNQREPSSITHPTSYLLAGTGSRSDVRYNMPDGALGP